MSQEKDGQSLEDLKKYENWFVHILVLGVEFFHGELWYWKPRVVCGKLNDDVRTRSVVVFAFSSWTQVVSMGGNREWI